MNTLRKIIHSLGSSQSSSRFERYYSGVIRNGSGYPTADEARQDLRSYDKHFGPYTTWMR
jgi:hypothetical protein